jgi:ankyrin repeat protein
MSQTAAVGRAVAVLLVLAAPTAAGQKPATGGTALRFGGPLEVDASGVTALHRAVESEDATAVEQLIRGGADVNAMTRFHVTPLSIATVRGNVEIARALLIAGANPNAAMGAGEPVILTAARTGNVPLLQALVDAGADVNARERFYGQTPLMWAAIEDHAAAIQLLAGKGADVNARANMLEGEPTWRYGADSRNGINGEALQNFNTNFSKGGLTPLMYAAREGSASAVRALMDAGASHSTVDPEGFTPLLLAVLNGHYDTAAALVEKGADVNQADRSGQTALFAVTDLRSLLWVYNRPRPRPRTTLDSVGLARLLLDKGAKVDAKLTGPARRPMGGGGSGLTGRGATAFLRAAVASDLPMMQLLLERGADAKVTTANGVNALHAAAGLRWSDNSMSWAVAQGLATEEMSLEAVDLLLDRGLDVNAVDDQGATALHGAASRGANEIIRLLVSKGAKLDIKTKPRVRQQTVDNEPPLTIPARTPLDEAIESDPARPATVALLRELMGLDPNAPIQGPSRRR